MMLYTMCYIHLCVKIEYLYSAPNAVKWVVSRPTPPHISQMEPTLRCPVCPVPCIRDCGTEGVGQCNTSRRFYATGPVCCKCTCNCNEIINADVEPNVHVLVRMRGRAPNRRAVCDTCFRTRGREVRARRQQRRQQRMRATIIAIEDDDAENDRREEEEDRREEDRREEDMDEDEEDEEDEEDDPRESIITLGKRAVGKMLFSDQGFGKQYRPCEDNIGAAIVMGHVLADMFHEGGPSRKTISDKHHLLSTGNPIPNVVAAMRDGDYVWHQFDETTAITLGMWVRDLRDAGTLCENVEIRLAAGFLHGRSLHLTTFKILDATLGWYPPPLDSAYGYDLRGTVCATVKVATNNKRLAHIVFVDETRDWFVVDPDTIVERDLDKHFNFRPRGCVRALIDLLFPSFESGVRRVQTHQSLLGESPTPAWTFGLFKLEADHPLKNIICDRLPPSLSVVDIQGVLAPSFMYEELNAYESRLERCLERTLDNVPPTAELAPFIDNGRKPVWKIGFTYIVSSGVCLRKRVVAAGIASILSSGFQGEPRNQQRHDRPSTSMWVDTWLSPRSSPHPDSKFYDRGNLSAILVTLSVLGIGDTGDVNREQTDPSEITHGSAGHLPCRTHFERAIGDTTELSTSPESTIPVAVLIVRS